ncbi:MAG: DEAD/DEAH box helicase family protein, partial [Clostridia bacterium]|nr:DEAD/DEAH box helicase family protein [Clostridia bacterium]
MYKVIQRFCDNEHDNGLILLDMPTGSGKTYSVLNYIFDAVLNSDNKRRYFFITTLKKNLPIEDLRKRFEKVGKLDIYKEKFLFVDSNSESVISGLTKDVIATIPYEIKKTEEYKKFESFIKSIQGLREKKGGNDLKSILIAAEDKLRTEVEPRFRRYIQNLLAKKYVKLQERKNAIKTEKDWQWVEKLYPSVFMKDKQIIFMSVDKFLSQNSTIVEPSCMLYNSDLIKDSVIFIDEFDASKDTILKNIIQNGLRERVDYIELFKSIYASLHTHKLPSVLTTPSKKRQESTYKDQSLQSVIDGIVDKAEDIYKLYTLQFSHKTETITDDSVNNFLFQDHQYLSILNGNKSFISAVSDNKRRINAIQFTDDKPTDETSNIQVMLGKLRGFISYFLGGVNILAINYQQCKAERRKPNEEEFSHESALRTVLAEFGLDSTYISYLTSQILIASRKEKGNIEGSEFDLSFYEKGFRYYAFEDDYSHDTQSKIMMYSFQTTPEKLILRFCEKAKVIGISATATVPTAVGNFNIDYL